MHTLEELKSELSMPTSSKVQLGSSMLHVCAKTKLPAHGVFRELVEDVMASLLLVC